MALEFLTQEARSVEAEVTEPQWTFEPADEMKEKRTSKVLLCLLCVAILLVLNITYNFSVAEKGTPILQTILKNPIFDFAGASKENPLLRKEAINSIGVITAILHNENNPTALVGIKLVHEGDVISGAEVIKIHRDRVEFDRDGFSWTQRILEKPEPEIR